MDRQKIERSIKGLSEWQMHVQAESDIDTNISTAIEALKAQLSQEGTTKDAISRQAAIEKFAMTAPQMSVIRIYEVVEILESMPTIQPEPRTGKWALGFDNRYMEKYYYCSRCGGRKYGEHEPLDYFCSNCGADMRGEKDG